MSDNGNSNESLAAAGEVLAAGQSLQRVQTGYTTAVAVQRPRDKTRAGIDLDGEATLSGESFYYGWGQGDNKIEGPSIKLANAAARCWGNCAVELLPVQETHDAWIFQAAFIDLETGYTTTRQFRQDKRSIVHGKHDEMRKADIRFQIGQSKAIRNAIINALPSWYIDRALETAKNGARVKLQAYISKIDKEKGKGAGIVQAVDAVLTAIVKCGVKEPAILAKLGIADRKAIDVDRLLILRGDLTAMDNGEAHVADLYPPPKTDQLADKIEAGKKANGKGDKKDDAEKDPEDALFNAAGGTTDEQIENLKR